MDPSGKNVAVHAYSPLALTLTNTQKYSFIFLVDSTTGAPVTKMMRLSFAATYAYHVVKAPGMLLFDDGSVFMVMHQQPD